MDWTLTDSGQCSALTDWAVNTHRQWSVFCFDGLNTHRQWSVFCFDGLNTYRQWSAFCFDGLNTYRQWSAFYFDRPNTYRQWSVFCFDGLNTYRQWSAFCFDGLNTCRQWSVFCFDRPNTYRQWSMFCFDGLNTVQTVVSVLLWWTEHSTDSGQCSALMDWTQYRQWSVFCFDGLNTVQTVVSVPALRIDSDTQYYDSACDLDLGQCSALAEWTHYRGWSVFYFSRTVTYNTATVPVSRQSRSVPCFDWVNTVQRTVSVLLWWTDSDIQYCNSACVDSLGQCSALTEWTQYRDGQCSTWNARQWHTILWLCNSAHV